MNEIPVTLTGNVVSDVHAMTTEAGAELAYFRMASTSRRYDRAASRWVDGETSYVRVSVWRQLARNVVVSIHKGDPVVVTGRLATWSWINKETGEVQDKLVLEAVSVGHDLCRGTSTFQRAERATPEPSVNDGEIFRNLENVDGNASQHSATSGQAEQAA